MLPILNQSFWRDEAFSILLSENSPLRIVQLTIKDQSPPLYSILLHYWMLLFGQSEAGIRGLSFLFHIGLVIGVYLLLRKIVASPTVQVVTTVATLLNPFLLQYAFEARAYSLLAMLTIFAVYCIAIRKYWLSGIFLSLGILTHNFGLFNCIAVGIWWIMGHRNQLRSSLKEGIALMVFPLITLAIWGGVIWNQWERVGKGFWIKQATSAIFITSLQKYTQGDITFSSQAMLYLLSVILFFIAFSYWIWKKEREETKIPSLLFCVGLIPLCITYIISALFVPIYHERYLIATVPMLIVLTGYSLYKVYVYNPTKKILLVVFISAYMTILVLSSEQIVGQSTKAPINWAVSQIVRSAQPGDVIIPKDALNYLETKFYVEKDGSTLPVYAYSSDGKIPFFIGGILFDQQHIITSLPQNKRIWQITGDGGYSLLSPQKQKKP